MPPYTLCKAVQQFNGKNWKKIGERKHRGIARPKCSYQYDTSYQESFVRPPAAMPTVEIVLCAYSCGVLAGSLVSGVQELGINALHIKLRATGGNKTKTPGLGAQSALRALAWSGMKIGCIGH
ncbi:hypothetical protein Ccrd_004327 [Cynara cardunculus var. scolymus]|uniref:40S ribosomal protein S14 n=1 Tax=Cynara cardunculus var. scolymus TaxID=59895 RepID=A0A118JV76_CYNCS|nr:hypothetical protein Ccrd_004327 [Cynara cardunculus var. scolymus]